MTTRLVMIAVFAMSLAPAANSAGIDIEQLAWLAGCWTGGSNGRQTDEQWMKPAGGTMFGMSRTVASGKTVESEFLALRQNGPAIVYVAKPASQPEASFTLVSGDATHAQFENPQHDFPQRIIYRLQPDGSLRARIEGSVNGKARAVDYPMTRAACP